jgi:excisionase family DNA binding protein
VNVQGETTVRSSLMTIEQAGERLGVSTRHMRRLVAERRIPYVKWGHLLRFDPLAIDEWVERFSVEPAVSRPMR